MVCGAGSVPVITLAASFTISIDPCETESVRLPCVITCCTCRTSSAQPPRLHTGPVPVLCARSDAQRGLPVVCVEGCGRDPHDYPTPTPTRARGQQCPGFEMPSFGFKRRRRHDWETRPDSGAEAGPDPVGGTVVHTRRQVRARPRARRGFGIPSLPSLDDLLGGDDDPQIPKATLAFGGLALAGGVLSESYPFDCGEVEIPIDGSKLDTLAAFDPTGKISDAQAVLKYVRAVPRGQLQ